VLKGRLSRLERRYPPPRWPVVAIVHEGEVVALCMNDDTAEFDNLPALDQLPAGVEVHVIEDLDGEITAVSQSLREDGVAC
jgi:hypothetical protein